MHMLFVNRMEGADKSLEEMGVKMHSILNILRITETLFEQNLVGGDILEKIKKTDQQVNFGGSDKCLPIIVQI